MFKKKLLIVSAVATFTIFPMVTSAQEASTGDIPISLEQLVETWILREGIENILANIEASKSESGDLDKLIRATSGVSIRDIKKYGLRGGPNSEVSKILRALGAID